MKHVLSVCALFVCLCMGTPAIADPFILCFQPSDRIVPMPRCDSTAQPVQDNEDIALFVAKQMQNGGNVIGWMGRNRGWTIARFSALVREFAKYKDRVTMLYVQDEADLCISTPCIGRDEDMLDRMTKEAHEYGFLTSITLTPSVIFAPGFKVPNVDVIGIDPYYVTMTLDLDMGGCLVSPNLILNQWECSIAKLRALGWVNPDGTTRYTMYIGQGFGLSTDTPQFRDMYLQMQADAFRVIRGQTNAVMSWGCYLAPEDREGGVLVPLCGTPEEYKVTPY